MCGQGEASAEVIRCLDGFQALMCVGRHLLGRRGQQVGIGLVVGTSHAAAQLVELCQAEFVGTLNNDGVGARDIDPRLDNGRTNENIEASVIEIGHHLFELALGHLPVGEADAGLGDQLFQFPRRLADTLDFVVQLVDLPAA